MGMNSSAHAYEQAQSYELRNMRVLDGRQAKAREDARRGDVVKITLAVSTIFMFLLGMTFMSAKIYSLDAKINTIQAEIAQTEELSARAELEIGELSSLSRIEAYAKDNLEMVYPSAHDFYYLDEESSLAIAQGKQDLALASATAETLPEENRLWSSFVNGLADFFVSTASAAEN